MIRLEEERDYKIVENLTREAFWNVYKPGCDEHYVLHIARNTKEFIKDLSLVIENDNEIIGHIMFVETYLKSKTNIPIVLFGPVSIIPKYQRQGYGTKLIDFAIKKAKNMGYKGIVITGDPDYYHRFGFLSAKHYDIHYNEYSEEELPFFMALELEKGHFHEPSIYNDPDVYITDPYYVAEFDKTFPYKEKKVLPTQIF